MGFWDFIAPDQPSFVEALTPWVPFAVTFGNTTLSAENLLNIAYYSPASAAGLVARTAYTFKQDAGGTPGAAGAAQQALADQFSRGGIYPVGQRFVAQDLTEGHVAGTLVIPNTYEITVRMVCGGRAVVNVFFANSNTRGLEATIGAAFLAAWKRTASAPFGPLTLLSSSLTMVSVTTVDIHSTTGGMNVILDSTAGGSTGALAPRSASILCRYNGSSRSRSTRGRSYLGPIAAAGVGTDGATLTTSTQTNAATYMNNVLSAMSTAGFPMCVASRKLLTTTPITALAVSPTLATQRHRLRS